MVGAGEVFEDVANGLVAQAGDAGVRQGAAKAFECGGGEDGVPHWVGQDDEDVCGGKGHFRLKLYDRSLTVAARISGGHSPPYLLMFVQDEE